MTIITTSSGTILDFDADRAEFERQLAFAQLDATDITLFESRVIAQAIKHVAARGEEFQADDIRPLLPDVHPNRIGRMFAIAGRRGEIRMVRAERSNNTTRKGGLNRVWRKVDDEIVTTS